MIAGTHQPSLVPAQVCSSASSDSTPGLSTPASLSGDDAHNEDKDASLDPVTRTRAPAFLQAEVNSREAAAELPDLLVRILTSTLPYLQPSTPLLDPDLPSRCRF